MPTSRQTTPTATDKLIEDVRKLVKPSPVKIGHVPRWFKKAYKKAMDERFGWFDHWGSTVLADGTPAFVSEPYQVNAKELAQCEALAKEFKLRFWLDAKAWWYPTWTLRLVFTPEPNA